MGLNNNDIFYDWKSKRFIIAEYALLDLPDIVVVLTDISFWSENIDKLIHWCKQYGGKVKGMTVEFDTQEQLTMFILRWS